MKRILAAIVILAVAKGLAGWIVKKHRSGPRMRTHQSRSIHGVRGRVTPRVGLQRNARYPGGGR